MAFEDIEILSAAQIEQPPGMKITRGFRILVPLRDPPDRRTPGYWKFGIRTKVFNWLEEHIGNHSSYIDWENRESNKGFWLHTGSQQKQGFYKTPVDRIFLANFWFDTRDDAFMFKLVWAGRL